MIAAEQHPLAYVIRAPNQDWSIEDREPREDERAQLTDQDVAMGMFVHTVPEEEQGYTHMELYHPGKFSQIPAIIEHFTPEDERPAPEVDPTAAAADDEEMEDSEEEPLPPEPTDDDQAEKWRIYESRMAGRMRRRNEKKQQAADYREKQRQQEIQQRRKQAKEAQAAKMAQDVREGRPPGMPPMMPRPATQPRPPPGPPPLTENFLKSIAEKEKARQENDKKEKKHKNKENDTRIQ